MNIQQIPSAPAGGQNPNVANNNRAVNAAPLTSPQPLALVRYDPKIAQQRLAEAQALNQAKSPIIAPKKPINPFAPVPDNRPAPTNQPRQITAPTNQPKQNAAPPTAPAPLPSPQPLAMVRYDPKVAQQRLAEAQALNQAKSPVNYSIITPKKPVNPFAPASDAMANDMNQPKQVTVLPNAPAQVQGSNSQALALKTDKPQPTSATSSLGDVFEKILKNQQMLESKVLMLQEENRKLKEAYDRIQTERKPENPIDLNKAR